MRLGIVAAVHEDALSLLQALTLLKEKACDHIVCLGDIVGFSVPYYRHLATRDAHAAISLVREHCAYTVAGNHDCFHARRRPKHTIFSYPAGWYDLDPDERRRLSRGRVYTYDDDLPADLTADDTAFLHGLPEYTVIVAGHWRILASHYVYPNLIGDQIAFDAVSDGIGAHLQFMRANGADMAIFSHDLDAGVRLFAGGEVLLRSYGLHPLPPLPLALNGPWVARGTEPSGAMILDTDARTIEVIALGSA